MYGGAPARETFGITTYAVAPIVLDDGSTIGTLCALDSESVEVPEQHLRVLRTLAKLIGLVFDDRRRRQELRDVLVELNRMHESRERFVQRIAADLTEPLEHMRGILTTLSDHELDERARSESLAMVTAQSHRISAMLSGMVETEASSDDPAEPLEAVSVLRAAGRTARAVARPNVEVEVEGEGVVAAPPAALTRLLDVLVLGAAQRMESGRLRIAGQAVASGFVIEVEDEGRPLSDDERAGLTGQSRGAGPAGPLPLAIARRLAQRIGAELHVNDADTAGTRIAVVLPLTPV